MATAQTIISRAARLIGKLESGETLDGTSTAEMLEALNAMIDSWRNDRLMVYAITNVTKTLTIGDGQYSIGSGADINTSRPVKIVGAYVTDAGIDYPIEVIEEEAYRRISDKTTQSSYPDKVYYSPQVANGQIYLHPVPSKATVLTLAVWTPISTFASTGTTVTLPPGYERALAYNLAVDYAPETGQDAPANVVAVAAQAKAAIKRANIKPFSAKMEFAGGRRYQIEADQ